VDSGYVDPVCKPPDAACEQAGPARERALRVKYDEYLPLGLVPAIVHVT